MILLVEDYEDSRYLTKLLLEMLGYSVIEAADGREAVELALQKNPGLILMDIGLPEMDGITATKIIRASDELADVPVVFITAHSDKYKEDAVRAGCNEIVSKPIDLETLKSVVTHYLPQTH